MPKINAPELGIFKEAAATVIEFTDEEYRELRKISEQIKGILDKAKKRQPIVGQPFQIG
jgi:hypothetical protein